ncbi:MAG: alpha/beta fold hydrolase [Herminiimonas sp.]|nr:alpha/beta fold hydrolase [Herminiimonas sp.]
MTWRFFYATALLGMVLSILPGAVMAQSGRSCHLPGYDQALRCINVAVPLDYRRPDGAKLSLHVTLAPAFREGARPDPLFVLAGGPGQAGSDILPLLDGAFRRIRATRDIVFIDQRGTGLSGKLDCDTLQSLVEKELTEQEATIKACLATLDQRYAFYNTDSAARDLDRIRVALGFKQVNLWGSSYGTRLGQTYARLFPGAVRALILDAVAAPDQIVFAWGQDAQASLDMVFKLCAADRACRLAYPQLPRQFAALASQVAAGAATLDFPHPRTARPTAFTMSSARFLQTVRAALYAGATGSRLPFLIDSASKGNWRPFAAQMYSNTDLSLDGPSIGLMLSVTCAEDISRVTPAILANEERNSFVAGSELKVVSRWCSFVNVPAVPYREPAIIDAPVLLLSGALDPVTPPRRADSAARYMRHAQHHVVASLGHGVSQYGCAPRLLREFLDQPAQPLVADCLKEIPMTSFQLGTAGPQP